MPRIPSCLRVVLTMSDPKKSYSDASEMMLGCERTEDALVAWLAKDCSLCL